MSLHEELYADAVKAIGEVAAVVFDDPNVDSIALQAEGARYLTRVITAGTALTIEAWDAQYPRFAKQLATPTVQFGLNCPDCHYLWAPIHGDHVYRIFGTRGSARILDLETRVGHICHVQTWKLTGKRDRFESGPGGELVITLSRNEQGQNWVPIPEGPGAVILRQYFCDWENEIPAELSIERIGAQMPPPPLDPGAVAERLHLFKEWMQSITAVCAKQSAQYYTLDPTTLSFEGWDIAFSSIQYGKSHFRCADDEALIIEFDPPDCPFWNIALYNHFWEAMDFDQRQTSINCHQAALDPDGRFRAVIAQSDPGVVNWLDPGGHTSGLICARYLEPPSVQPVTIRRVGLDSVRSQLPSTTPTLTPEERRESLRRRMLSVPRRYGH
jgi:hypothetical protein